MRLEKTVKLLRICLLGALAVFLFLHCAEKKADVVKNPSGNSTGILMGRVTIGPICPVERIDQPCDPPPEMYAKHRLVLLSTDGTRKIQEITMDGKGYYKTEAPAGDYLLDFVPHDIGIGEKPPKPVHIEAGQTMKFDLDIDTGIR